MKHELELEHSSFNFGMIKSAKVMTIDDNWWSLPEGIFNMCINESAHPTRQPESAQVSLGWYAEAGARPKTALDPTYSVMCDSSVLVIIRCSY